MNWIKPTIIIIFIFGMGWMFGLFVEHFDLFHLSFEVPAFSIINLLVISFLAWYVNYSLQNRQRKNKSKIDLLSNKIDEVDSYLKRILDLTCKDTGASYIEMCKLDKWCRNWAKRIISVIETKYCDVCPKDKYVTLTQDLVTLRSLVTSSSIIIAGQPQDVLINNNIVTYSASRRAEIDVLVDSIRNTLYNIKIGVAQK